MPGNPLSRMSAGPCTGNRQLIHCPPDRRPRQRILIFGDFQDTPGMSAPQTRSTLRLTRPNPGINTLPRLVGLRIVKGMRTAREQKEASTVHTGRDKANMSESQRRHAQQVTNYPWSLPSRVAMSFCLGIAYALASGQVPV